jgi:hypothetical protein
VKETENKTIDVYILDKDNRVVAKNVAHEFPLAPGLYNIPYRAVSVKPPVPSVEDAVAIWKTEEDPGSPDFHHNGKWDWWIKPVEVKMPTRIDIVTEE